MSERLRSDSARYQNRYQTNSAKMSEGDLLGTRKTLFVLVIVVGCFAVLWPKVFYPMLVGPTNQRMKPNSLDKGCCDVLSDIDVNTIKIMSELCNNIVQQNDEKPLKGPEIIRRCRDEIFNTCGIDISAILQEQVRLGRTFKQIVDEVRSLNGSLCLKYKFGISPWRLGASHKVTISLSPVYVKQERPAHLRPEMLHPALREKGRAIAQPYQSPPKKGTPPKFVEGRPGPVPGVRPPMGGAGHVVHPQKNTTSMGIIMPIYTVGIVIFFSYTLMKLLFKKKPEGPGAPLYPPVDPSLTFRKDVFESQKSRPPQGPGSSKLVVNAMTALLDEVDQELEARRRASEVASQKEPTSNGTVLANGNAKQEHEQPSVKVLGMEMTASCEGGERWSRPESPVMPSASPPPPEPTEPPQEIYLEGALPAQSQILVADSTTEAEPDTSNLSPDPAVVLASKMTLSVISLDSQENDHGIEATEKGKLRNGDAIETENDTLDEDVIDESKYTTASGATAAERDISEGEQTDEDHDIEEEMERVPECVVDNGAPQIENIEDLHDDVDLNLDVETKPENVEAKQESGVRFSEDIKDESSEAPKTHESSIRFSEDVIENDEKEIDIMSPEEIESIGDVIDDVINVGTRMSELISAEQEAELDEQDVDDPIEKENLEENLVDTDKVSIKALQKEPIEIESEEEEKETRASENIDIEIKKTAVKPVQQKAKPVESDSEEEEEIEVEEEEKDTEVKKALVKPVQQKAKPVQSDSEEEEEIEIEVEEEEEEEEVEVEEVEVDEED